jgi:hypothetical protein
MISIIEPSPHDAGTAYVAATRYKSDDFAPYLYKTSDYGATWTKITDGIAENAFTRVIRADPGRKGYSMRVRRRACTSPSTTARTGSRCSATCPSCRSTTSR